MKYSYFFLTLILFFSCKTKAQKTTFIVNCVETIDNNLEYPNKDGVRTKTCEYKNYIFKSIGNPDYKGRYSSYEYQLLRIEKSDTIQISNSDFFYKNYKELEKLINDKLKVEYEINSNDPSIKNCIELIDFRYYNLNEFGISFDQKNQIEFHISFDIISACLNVGGSIITLDYNEFEKYLK